ncbi:MAG: hypothetical protein AAF727_07910 [Pseudomonadota bacterium]
MVALGFRLRRVGPDTLRHALGIAEYHSPRSQMMREIANPTMLHDGSGMGALMGCMSLFLAQDGFEGAPAITVEAPEAAPYWADLGRKWTVMENYIKPYPICRRAHAALDGLGQLMRDHALVADDIVQIRVNTFQQAACLFAGMPETTSQAQYSLGFALAVQAVHGHIGPDHISGAGLRDATVADILPRIVVSKYARHSSRFPTGRWSDVTLLFQDGRQLASGDIHARGGPEAPMMLDEGEQKFHATSGDLSPQRKDAIWAMRDAMLRPDVPSRTLLALLHAPSAPH